MPACLNARPSVRLFLCLTLVPSVCVAPLAPQQIASHRPATHRGLFMLASWLSLASDISPSIFVWARIARSARLGLSRHS